MMIEVLETIKYALVLIIVTTFSKKLIFRSTFFIEVTTHAF